MILDRLLVVLHVIGVVLWLGPSLGAWLVYLQARREGHGLRAVRWFERVVRIEHAGLLLLVVTGVAMVVRFGFWPPAGWLAWKLALFAGIVLPFELVDLYLAHRWLARALAGADPQGAAQRFHRFMLILGAPLVLVALAILVLAVAKPAL